MAERVPYYAGAMASGPPKPVPAWKFALRLCWILPLMLFLSLSFGIGTGTILGWATVTVLDWWKGPAPASESFITLDQMPSAPPHPSIWWEPDPNRTQSI